MKIYIYFIYLFILILNSRTYAADLFDTNFNEISFVSQNIEETKNEKIKDLKIDLIREVFKKILTDNDYKKIKRDIDEHFTNALIKNLIIENESIINDRYSAKIKINFDKNLILNYLRIEKIPYVYYLPDSFFTIILENNGVQKNLLTDKNIYYKFLLKNKNNYFDFYKIPNLDINDRFLLSYDNIDSMDMHSINKILNKYLEKDMLLINSVLIDNIYYIHSYILLNNEFILVNKYSFNKINLEDFFIRTKFEVLDTWKHKNNIQNKKINEINCEVNYLNLFELKEIKSLFYDISPIISFRLKNIILYKNMYEIKYYGNYIILKELFNSKNINIDIINNKCEIRLI